MTNGSLMKVESIAEHSAIFSTFIKLPFQPVHEISKNCGILTCVDSDEPLQPPFKLRHSKWCSVSRLIIIEQSSN